MAYSFKSSHVLSWLWMLGDTLAGAVADFVLQKSPLSETVIQSASRWASCCGSLPLLSRDSAFN